MALVISKDQKKVFTYNLCVYFFVYIFVVYIFFYVLHVFYKNELAWCFCLLPSLFYNHVKLFLIFECN